MNDIHFETNRRGLTLSIEVIVAQSTPAISLSEWPRLVEEDDELRLRADKRLKIAAIAKRLEARSGQTRATRCSAGRSHSACFQCHIERGVLNEAGRIFDQFHQVDSSLTKAKGRHGPRPCHRQADRRDARRSHLGGVDAGQGFDLPDGATYPSLISQESAMSK